MSALRDYLQTQDVIEKRQSNSSLAKEKATSVGVPTERRGLELLSQSEFPVALPELFERSGLSLDEFQEALEALRKAKLVNVRQGDGGRIVELTDSGQALLAT